MHLGSVPPANVRITITALTNVAQSVFAAVAGAVGGTVINGFVINGGAAAETVIFRSEDDATEYFRVNVPAGGFATHEQLIQFASVKGLEILTDSIAGDVEVTVFYWKPGAYGIGV